MKILLVIEATLGGTARHIVDLAEGLLHERHVVHLVYSQLRADSSFERGLQHLRHNGPAFHSFELATRRSVGLSDIGALLRLHQYVREHGPFDVIHSHSTKAGFLARLLPRNSQTASIYSPHALMTQDPALPRSTRLAVSVLEAGLARRCDAVIAISAMERGCAVATGIPEAKLSVVHNGSQPTSRADVLSRADVRAELGLPIDGLCIGTVGLLVDNKEHARLLEAFALFQQEYRQRSDLVVIGWGPLKQTLREKAEALGIGRSVHLLGQVPARKYFPGFDILAHPSRYEGFAYTFLEALQTGVPIVTTNVGGAVETVIPDVTGYIVDPWDSRSFAERLVRLGQDPGKRATMGRAGKSHAENFTSDRMVRSTLAVYEACLARKSASHRYATGALSRESE